MRITAIALLTYICITAQAQAQLRSEDLQRLVVQKDHSAVLLQFPEDVKEFYRINHYSSTWINNNYNKQYLIQLLNTTSSLGLEEQNYQYEFIQSFENNLTTIRTHYDSLLAEIRFTDAAIHFFHDAAYGSRKPLIGYNGLNYYPDCFNIPALLAGVISENRLPLLLKDIEPSLPGYTALKKLLNVLTRSVTDSMYKETKITSKIVNNKNLPLVKKLYYLGLIDSINGKYSDLQLKEKVKLAQRMFNLTDDGMLRTTVTEALNVPLPDRIEELKAAMNTVRWLQCISELSPVIIVNIPSANLMVLSKGSVVMQSKVIVGKKSTPTPTLASTITEVVLYPYWIVPSKIATHELLPLIKRNTDYLDANNIQVLNKNGKVVNPYQIDWHSLSTSYFPYTLRQSTGCDNSLGLVKLNFYSPYSVYLHDTPWKMLFNFNKRYFSHGCVRVEKAIPLAHFLLKENTIAIDTLEEKGCLRNQSPIGVPIYQHIPVFILYNTSWIDSSAVVQFNDDVYGKNIR